MRIILLLSALLAATSCAPVGEKLALIKHRELTGDSFNTKLATEYRDYAESLAERGHTIRADRFAEKALDALDGETDEPEEKEGLEKERAALIDALIPEAKEVAPAQAARAQALFDCWADEKGRMASSEELCQQPFATAFDDLQYIADTLVHGAGNRFAVHFAPGTSQLSDNGRLILDIVSGRVRGQAGYNIELTAYGKQKTLASRRILSIEKALIAKGVDAGNIKRLSADHGGEVFLDARETGETKDAVGITLINLPVADKEK